jgi:hypothetical protein
MTEPSSVIASMRALFDAEPEQADAFLMAAVYCRAIREHDSPRNIVNALWKAVPDTGEWPAFRNALMAAIES